MNGLPKPSTDPTPIFEHFRGTHGTELLVAGTCHLKLFDKLVESLQSLGSPITLPSIRKRQVRVNTINR